MKWWLQAADWRRDTVPLALCTPRQYPAAPTERFTTTHVTDSSDQKEHLLSQSNPRWPAATVAYLLFHLFQSRIFGTGFYRLDAPSAWKQWSKCKASLRVTHWAHPSQTNKLLWERPSYALYTASPTSSQNQLLGNYFVWKLDNLQCVSNTGPLLYFQMTSKNLGHYQ